MRIFVVLAILFAFVVPTWAQEISSTLTLSGSGQVSAAPDAARISIGVETEAPTADRALKANSAKMRNVFIGLDELGVERRNIQTNDFTVYPRFARSTSSDIGPPKVVAFGVANNVTVKVVELESLGAILDAVVKSGANRIHSINFLVLDPGPHLDKARALAVQQVIRKAGIYAQSAGLVVGDILSIAEGSGTPPSMRREAFALASDAVPIAQGEVALSATVTIRFALIKP
jgi:uncharacterized protein YggE